MIALAIDTSHPLGSMALASDGTLAGSTAFGSERSHLLEIGESLKNLAVQAGINLEDIGRLVLVSGPGSFTGLRVGMSFAKGLHAAMDYEVATVDTLRALALPILKRRIPVISMVNARRNEVYAGAYVLGMANDPLRPYEIFPPQVEKPEVFLHNVLDDVEIPSNGRIIFIGSGSIVYCELIDSIFKDKGEVEYSGDGLPSTEFLAMIADCIPVVPSGEIQHLEPIYIRPSDAELKKLREVRGEGT